MDRPSRKSQRGSAKQARLADSVDFWQAKPLDQLAADQAVSPVNDVADVLGKGATLWADDAELDRFLAELAKRRPAGG